MSTVDSESIGKPAPEVAKPKPGSITGKKLAKRRLEGDNRRRTAQTRNPRLST